MRAPLLVIDLVIEEEAAWTNLYILTKNAATSFVHNTPIALSSLRYTPNWRGVISEVRKKQTWAMRREFLIIYINIRSSHKPSVWSFQKTCITKYNWNIYSISKITIHITNLYQTSKDSKIDTDANQVNNNPNDNNQNNHRKNELSIQISFSNIALSVQNIKAYISVANLQN